MNPSPYSSKVSRVITYNDRSMVTVEELNQLLVRSGQPPRSLAKLTIALDASLACISARLLREKTLVGFARLEGDGVFQATVWDCVVDPNLPQPEAVKRLVLERMKREVRQRYSKCCISIFSSREDYALFNVLGFREDEKGIRGMQLRG
ncbi:MAG: hypothetical protein ACO3EZ_10675 [Prochlorotrichaceae cyanobacterium]